MRFVLLLLLLMPTFASAQAYGPEKPTTTPFGVAIATGTAGAAWSSERKFGHREGVTATPADVWTGTANDYPFAIAPDVMRVAAGGDIADDAAGAGARSVTIVGLAAGTWAEAQETVATAGIGASAPTAQSFIRVFRCFVEDVGAYGASNVADISVETTGGVELCHIQAARSRSQMAIWTVPAGKTAWVVQPAISVEGNFQASMVLNVRQSADTVLAPFAPTVTLFEVDGLTGTSAFMKEVPIEVPGRSDVWWTATGAAGGIDVTIDTHFFMLAD